MAGRYRTAPIALGFVLSTVALTLSGCARGTRHAVDLVYDQERRPDGTLVFDELVTVQTWREVAGTESLIPGYYNRISRTLSQRLSELVDRSMVQAHGGCPGAWRLDEAIRLHGGDVLLRGTCLKAAAREAAT